jgi:hypothetical protein
MKPSDQIRGRGLELLDRCAVLISEIQRALEVGQVFAPKEAQMPEVL